MAKVLSLLGILVGFIWGTIALRKHFENKFVEIRRMSDKHLEMFLLMNRWFQNERKGKKLSNYLEEIGANNVAIYGIGYIGKTLYEYLKYEDINISYVIDRKKKSNADGIEISTVEDDFDDNIDVVIVTAIYYFEELEDKLREKFKNPILSLADIIYKI